MKRCTVCGLDKVLSAFRPSRPSQPTPDGLHPQCRECCTAKRQAEYLANRERERALGNERQRQWRAENPGEHRAGVKAWVAANPEAARRQCRDKMAARRAAGQPAWGSAEWEAERLVVLERDDGLCGICGDDVDPLDYTLDHIIPISRNGPHDLANLQVAHALCNNRKYANVA